MERENPFKFMACATAALVAGVAFATPQVADDFESGSLDETVWTGGGGTITDGATTNPDCGFPCGNSTHAKVLSVSGEATRASGISSPAAQGQTDFLVNITEASDSETITTSPGSDVQIAIAAGSTITGPVSPATLGTIPLMIYCKAKSNGAIAANAAWLEGPSVTTGAWHRVSLVFDYSSGLCKVSVDGVPHVSSSGFLKATTADSDIANYPSQNGAWYGLVTGANANGSKITSLSFVGVASVDDVVIDGAESVAETYSGSGASVDGLAVSYTDLNKWGVNSETINTATLDDSGMTVAQKVVAGLVGDSMTDGTTFTAKAMTMTAEGTATITLPAGTVTAGRTYTINYTKADNTTGSATATADDNVLTVSDLPTDTTVLKFTITASAAQN